MGWQPESAIAPSSTALRHIPVAAAVSFLRGCACSMSGSLLNFVFGPVVDESPRQLIVELVHEPALEQIGSFLIGRHRPISRILGGERHVVDDLGPLFAR